MVPPIRVLLRWNRLPTLCPNWSPTTLNAAVVNPIIPMQSQMLHPIKAKETPQARASMLVAMARPSIVRKPKSLALDECSEDSDSVSDASRSGV